MLVVAAVIIGILALQRGDAVASAGPGPRVRVPHTSVSQARWKITTYPAGSLTKPGKSVKKAVARERPRLKRVVKDVYDSLFLVPDRYRQVVTGYFVPPGAGILLHTNLAPPHGAKDVSTRVRKASIGLQADTGARAAARVRVAAKAKDNGKAISWATVSTLWMEKQRGHWKVIGFDVSQASNGGKQHHQSSKGHRRHKGKN